MLPSLLAFEVPAFLLGLLFGSFLNVCISRLPWHGSIATPRSHCPRCEHPIRWYDNVPVLSWILLRAKCRDCGARIPWRYPLVEFATGIWFAIFAPRIVAFTAVARLRSDHAYPPAFSFLTAIDAVGSLVLGFLLIGLLVMDWQTLTLPDAFTLPGIAVGFVVVCMQAVFLPSGSEDIHLNPTTRMRITSPGSFVELGNVAVTGPEHLVFGRLLAIVAAALLPLLIRWTYRAIRKREGIGLGDIKLLAMIAAFLGFGPAMLSLFVALVLILPYGLFLLSTRRADAASRLPFGSFLCAGGLIAALVGEPLLAWYTRLL